jgi:hypothetical protein
MAQTVAGLADVLKEAWTSDRLEKQFYDENPFLDALTKGSYETKKSKIGEKAIVPIHKGRSGGYTSVSSAGGALNPADEQKVDAAEYTLVYHWFQIAIETGVINQSVGGATSVVNGKDLEIQQAVSDLNKQAMRQLALDNSGILAGVRTANSTTVDLSLNDADDWGQGALDRGWIYPGLLIDIGTTGDTDAIVAGTEVLTAVRSDTDPQITVAAAANVTAGTHFLYIANPNSGTAANPEINGIRNMVGSNTSAVGGLDPDTAGEEFWKPAKVDTTTTVFSIDLALDMQRAIAMNGGKPNYILTSLKQQQNFYSLLQNQVRFTGEARLGAGNVEQPTWNGMTINALPDILDQDFYMLDLSSFELIVGQGIQKPTWVSELAGNNQGMIWTKDQTAFNDAITWPFQIGLNRRNVNAAALGLTA